MIRSVSVCLIGTLCLFAATGVALEREAALSCEGVVDRDVIPLERPQPAYPAEAAMFCIEGEARYSFTIRPDGYVADVEVLESVPEGVFDQTARIFDFWRFSPRCVDGEAVSRTATQTVDFQLESVGGSHCPDQLPASAVPLQVELVALMQQVHEAMVSDEVPNIDERPVLDLPYAPIERAYRRSLKDQVELVLEQVRPVAREFQELIGRAESTPGLDLEAHVQRLEALRLRFDSAIVAWRPLVDRFLDELRSAADSVELSPGERRVFVDQLVDHPQAMYAQLAPVTEPSIQLMEREEALARWLAEHSHEWEFHRGRIRFASDHLEARFMELAAARDRALDRLELQVARDEMMWSGD